MTAKKVLKAGTKAAKVVGSCIVSAAILECGYLGGKMLIDDTEFVAKTVNSKINPTIMKKRHWYSKPEKFNTRTQTFVADKKKQKTTKKSK